VILYAFVTHSTVQNAFSKRLAHLGFVLYPMLVVDILHEFELGVWKVFLTHLVRILVSVDVSLINEMDRRCVLLFYDVLQQN
jgi:hypothetical protein